MALGKWAWRGFDGVREPGCGAEGFVDRRPDRDKMRFDRIADFIEFFVHRPEDVVDGDVALSWKIGEQVHANALLHRPNSVVGFEAR